MTLSTQWALDWAAGCARMATEHREELVQLDREIGDGDHGENLARGFDAVSQKLANSTPATPAEVLKTIATTLLSTVGGASGPLLGTAFLRGAKAFSGDVIDGAQIVEMIEAALGGIQARGKAAEGEKTMIDAWAPALRAAQEALAAGAGPAQILREAADAAAAGAEATVPLVATKGRASYLGDRSAGHMDPGARSSALMLDEAAKAAGA